MSDTHSRGLLDTCVVIDIAALSAVGQLPDEISLSSITMAELAYGIATARTPVEAVRRSQHHSQVQSWFDPLPFDALAAQKYGELVALVLAAGRHPRPRRIDLMIASIAVVHGLPLYTSNVDDFLGIESLVTVVPVKAQSL